MDKIIRFQLASLIKKVSPFSEAADPGSLSKALDHLQRSEENPPPIIEAIFDFTKSNSLAYLEGLTEKGRRNHAAIEIVYIPLFCF